MKQLDKGNIEAICKCLQQFERNTSYGEDGSPKISIDVPYFVAQEILYFNFPFEDGYPERTKNKILNLAIDRWLKYKKSQNQKIRFSAFQRAVKTELKYAEQKRQPYSVLMFLNIDRSSLEDFHNTVFLGKPLNFPAWNELSHLDTTRFWQELEFFDRNNSVFWNIGEQRIIPDTRRFTPTVCEINTYGPEAAIEIASDWITAFRCILNFTTVFGDFYYVRDESTALSPFLPSPVYSIFDQSGKFTSDLYSTIEKYTYKQEKVAETRKPAIKHLLSKYVDEPGPDSSWKYIIDLLYQYQNALDIHNTETAFLAMWRVLENSVCFGERLKLNSDVEARVRVLLPIDTLYRDMLPIITKHRNTLVHSGIFPERGNHLFFILKIFTDETISELISLAETYPTITELREYIKLKSLNDKDLERKKSVITKIELSRRKK